MKKLILYFFSLLSSATLFAGTYYDTGQKPTIALNDNNVVVEVHVSKANNSVAWSRVGDLNKPMSCIEWRDAAEKIDAMKDICTGMQTQQLCLNNNGVVTYLFVKGDENKMCIMIGVVDGSAIDWIPEALDTGFDYSQSWVLSDENMTISLDDNTLFLLGENFIMKEWTIDKQSIVKTKEIFKNKDKKDCVLSGNLLGACITRSTGEILLFRDDDTHNPNNLKNNNGHESLVFLDPCHPDQKSDIKWKENIGFSFDTFAVTAFDAKGTDYIVIVYGEDDIKKNDIYYKIGKYIGGDIDWGERGMIDTGRSNDPDYGPKVSANSDGWVIEAHQNQEDDKLYYNVGQFDGTGETDVIKWKNGENNKTSFDMNI